jgi:ankyrin repeat protein
MNPLLKAWFRGARLSCVLLLAACAQAPSQPDVAAVPQAQALSAEDRAAFFVNHARQGEIEALRQDLDEGVAVNARDGLDQTALLAAISSNGYEEVHLLLLRGADPNLADNAGWTPLHYAAWFGSSTIVIADLLAHGAKIDARNDRGITPLYFASAAGHESQVKLLLQHGADRGIASNSGYTPLRVARVKGLDGVAALLDTDVAQGRTAAAGATR